MYRKQSARACFFKKIAVFAVFLAFLTLNTGFCFAQTQPAPAAGEAVQQPAKVPNLFQAEARAADSATLMVKRTPVYLWGVESVTGAGPAFDLKARTALDNVIGGKKAECEVKSQEDGKIHAQCVNSNDVDLGLFMLQQGYVTVDRSSVYGSVFEEPYVQAETRAQDSGLGIWAASDLTGKTSGRAEGSLMLSFGFILFLCIIVAFGMLSIIIMRGFQKVIDAQNDNVEMMTRERKLRDRERSVVAVMLDSELKANKSKIEAYLVVYEEMLKALKDPSRPPKYKKSGDIVQRQPALDRSVFDRNADKLDSLGQRLSSELIHFYARIKTHPDYEDIEPERELKDVIEIVEEAIGSARRLNKLADRLVESFGSSGVTSANPEEEEIEIQVQD